MARIILENVVKKYGDVTAVQKTNLEIMDKEFLILVGPSGCGKTTTLRMIAGLEEITSGNLYIDDKLVNDVPPKDRDIAMVFQNYALYPHLNVYNNMAFGLKLRKTPKNIIEERVMEAAKMLGIEELLHRKPRQLSGGQRQRVALGRAVVREPKAFLMDEPLSNLDAKLRVQMRAELKLLHERVKTTFVYVTHDQIEAMTMGDRLVVMNHGVIQQVDTPLTLYNKPANLFVAGFIGSPAMNFINCKLIEENDSLILINSQFRLTIDEARVTPKVKAAVNKEVIMGIRPDDIFDAEYSEKIKGNVNNTFTFIVGVVEPLGAETLVNVKIENKLITAKVDYRTKAIHGQPIKLIVDMSKVHVFDAVTEENLSI
ncbi:MAG: sn-glycerol-3-phosphate ABC transporter ATP-binding protein UgpC [Clostridia bacterium]|nr:sn-glycerol-3-phosphate ABC transporter ATP-binding protein UgpC [Clostridia bacterium]